METICCTDMERELMSKEFMDMDADLGVYLVRYEEMQEAGSQYINYCPFCGARIAPRPQLRYMYTPRTNYLPNKHE